MAKLNIVSGQNRSPSIRAQNTFEKLWYLSKLGTSLSKERLPDARDRLSDRALSLLALDAFYGMLELANFDQQEQPHQRSGTGLSIEQELVAAAALWLRNDTERTRELRVRAARSSVVDRTENSRTASNDSVSAIAERSLVEAWSALKIESKPGQVRIEERDLYLLWGHFLNVSLGSVYAYLTPRAFSDIDFFRIGSALGLRALLAFHFQTDFAPLIRTRPIRGVSGIPRFFDALITLRGESRKARRMLVKTSTFGSTGGSIINDFGVSFEDVKPVLDFEVQGVVFVPGYPNPGTHRAELAWNYQKGNRITVLYLADYFELFRGWEPRFTHEFMSRRTS